MKKRKGFTLVELLAVIVLLSIIATIAGLSISSIKDKVNEKEYKNLASSIEAAARGYAEETGITKIFVQTLIDKGLIEADDETKQIYDPRNSSSLNCQVVTFEKGEAHLSDDKNANCDPKILSDNTIKIRYYLTNDPSKTIRDIPNKWIKDEITLVVETKGINASDLEGATYKWASPLAPDKTLSSKELIITDKIVNDIYQVTINIGDRKYTATTKIQVDREAPKVYNLIDTKPEDWSSTKTFQFELSDSGSGIQSYQVSFDGNNAPSSWVKVNPTGQTNAKITVTKNLSSMNEGENIYVWVKDMVGNVNKTDLSYEGSGDGVLQINNIDTNLDYVTLTGTPAKNTYTREVQLTGSAQDLKSGIVGWYCSTSKTAPSKTSSLWKPVAKTNDINITCPTKATSNGEYYLHAIDTVGNTGTATYKVDNIDRVIDSVNISDTNSGYRKSTILKGTAIDNKAGIVGYSFSESSSKPSRFTPITATTSEITYNKTVESNKTYYFHVIDAAGNWSYDYITTKDIVKEQSYEATLYSTSSSRITDSFRLSGAVAITGYYSNTGQANVSLSGNYAYVSTSGGQTYKQSYDDTCYNNSKSYNANYTEKCSGRYSCPYGGDLKNKKCTGSTYILTSNPKKQQTYTCTNGSWVKTSGEWPSTNCKTGYYRTGKNDAFNCNNPTGSCTNGSKRTIMYYCQAYCYWSGDYNAECSGGTYNDYYCDSGDYLSGTTCYYCSGRNESYNRRTGECEYTCRKEYDYWQYKVTINYYVLK